MHTTHVLLNSFGVYYFLLTVLLSLVKKKLNNFSTLMLVQDINSIYLSSVSEYMYFMFMFEGK